MKAIRASTSSSLAFIFNDLLYNLNYFSQICARALYLRNILLNYTTIWGAKRDKTS